MFSNVSFTPSDVMKAKSLDEMYKLLEASEIWITTDLLAWIGMHALIHYNPVFSLQHSVFLSNPVQALLFHYVIENVLCYVVEEEIASKLPGDRSNNTEENQSFLVRKKAESEKMTRVIKEHCRKQEIEVPDFAAFYFQPSEEIEAHATNDDDDDDEHAYSSFYGADDLYEDEDKIDKTDEDVYREL
jgi:hypothetical protein